MSTSTRALELLGLLQGQRHWSGSELARRLNVSRRTLRRDVNGLQQLGYPIVTTRGTGGGYQLSAGASLPPLVLSEDEAAATVLGLKEIATGVHPASGEAAVTAIAKIVQVLPARIRGRIDSLRAVALPVGGAENRAAIGDITALTTLALACRDADAVVFAYRSRTGEPSRRTAQPHRIVNVENRLYLAAWDLDRADWRTFRVDRITQPCRTGNRFARRRLPDDDPVTYVRAQLGDLPSRYRVLATVHAPADRIREEIVHYGTVRPVDDASCDVEIAAESLDWAAFCLVAIGAPFVVHGPVEAVDYMRAWGRRLVEATS
ncbi:putative DNA-binding transcriptional regulator YafY, contains an HTH and WYL domains [Promicromonospora umidemergens]|uniref:WYL domain-containing protein n=1 Tax=Promicromonospora umidemergens TaxID=629679 RepID=A0ABP8Y9J3_9MICO|nr:YafY family protein [Promicromonospora umidemergens]MCP2284761.1 putative DNA-binding transcriptional regulator YafY, contains an HTH and WYL domains [Promicromonospora umidemergens]